MLACHAAIIYVALTKERSAFGWGLSFYALGPLALVPLLSLNPLPSSAPPISYPVIRTAVIAVLLWTVVLALITVACTANMRWVYPWKPSS